jgi:16S rRNA (guanine527-N7)-methyltransferase
MTDNPIASDKISGILTDYGVSPNPALPAQIATYVSLLLHWNQKISLTTVVAPQEIVRFHFGEGLFAQSSLSLENGRLADVGSGAGFPGLPLAIANPNLNVTLIESNAKKAAFLSEVVRKLELKNVQVARSRMEDLHQPPGSLEFVTARALGQFDKLLSWASGSLAKSGRLILWLGEDDVKSVSARTGWIWSAPILIPNSIRRFLLIGYPTS